MINYKLRPKPKIHKGKKAVGDGPTIDCKQSKFHTEKINFTQKNKNILGQKPKGVY